MRQCKDWLLTLQEYVEETESPRHFWLWAGISCIASALQRKVKLSFGMETVYPNNYIMIVALPGECRKSPPLKFMQKILQEIEASIFVDSPTKRALTKSLAEISKTTWFKAADGKPSTQCPLTIISKEFSSFLATDPKGMTEVLTDLYDSHDQWEYQTAGAGKDKLHNICINVIVATTPSWIATNLPEGAIGGGFTSRFIIVYGDDKYKWLSLPPPPPGKLYSSLKHDLMHIAQLTGTFKWDKEAYKIYDEWYQSIKETQRNLRDDRLRGFVSRMHTIMLKTAMSIRVSYEDNLILAPQDINRSIMMIESVLNTASDALGGQGAGKGAPDADRILKQIYKYKEIDYQELLQLNFRHTSKEEFDAVLATLEGMGVVTRLFANNKTTLIHKGYPRGAGKYVEKKNERI